jgi:hypothetical protein
MITYSQILSDYMTIDTYYSSSIMIFLDFFCHICFRLGQIFEAKLMNDMFGFDLIQN